MSDPARERDSLLPLTVAPYVRPGEYSSNPPAPDPAPWLDGFNAHCASCGVKVHCAHQRRCLADCVPADVIAVPEPSAPNDALRSAVGELVDLLAGSFGPYDLRAESLARVTAALSAVPEPSAPAEPQKDRKSCRHEDFRAEVKVTRLLDTGAFMAEISVECSQCGEPFRFRGVDAGLNFERPAVSIDGLELNAPIEPEGVKALQSGATYTMPKLPRMQ